MIPAGFVDSFIAQLDAVPNLASTSSAKFTPFEDWIERTLGRSAEVAYLSSLRQFAARMGQTLISLPDVIVLLSSESFSTAQRDGVPYVERLEAIVGYARRLEAIVACVGEEGDWDVEFVVGPHDSELRRELAAAFSSAQDRPVRPERPKDTVPPPAPVRETLDELAASLYLDPAWLRDVEWLLRDKRALVLYGPPGTGKTYIASKIATWLQPSARLRRTVQLHPSYGYEDFFEGYKPVGDEQGIALAKRDGPLRTLVRNALGSPGQPAVLVLDEMNRANLPRVFGELFYLLEYRDASMGLMYSPGEEFTLPEDFFVIGTMNTADRSVATLDQALRRRFHFVGLFPGEEPVRSMFRRYLEANHPQMKWLVSVLDRANELLQDRNLAIGPSHFMRKELDDIVARRIWQHSVVPTVRDQFFDDPQQVSAFDLDSLRSGVDEE